LPSAKTAFPKTCAYLQKHPGTRRTILVEKTDRLYRNLTDYATLAELGVIIHLAKESQIIGPDSKSSEQFVNGIKVLVARNYSQKLGEETVKGMTEKARAGIYPSFALVGYP
jgi:DNA invertase Pin-like site-specific DNA recombinase